MLSAGTKKILAEILVTVGIGHAQMTSIRNVMCNQSKFVLELVHGRLSGESSRTVTQSSLKKFLAENNIQCNDDEIATIFIIYSKFETQGLSLSE